MPRGGARAGAGRKPKDQKAGELHGSRRTRARAAKLGLNQKSLPGFSEAGAGNGTGLPGPHIPPAPGNLTLDELAVWNELAPLALKEGTLTESTSMALRDLCEAIVLKRKLIRTVQDEGVTVWGATGTRTSHPLLPQFRGLMQRVEAGMVRFKLAPMGKEIASQAEKPADPFAEFDQSAQVPGATVN